jgi:hypothetical protein
VTVATEIDRYEIPVARVVSPPPPTLVDRLSGAIDNLEAFLLDAYECGRVQDPEIIWAQGARDILVAVLGWLPLLR